MVCLVTGAAGFIGFHLAKRLLEEGQQVIGVDNLNDYYEVSLKESRLELLRKYPNFFFELLDVADASGVEGLFKKFPFSRVVHLAAQAGVRYSIQNPHAYIQSNLVGFGNILEGCRHHSVEHLVYASSSSVYGGNVRMPFSLGHTVDHPVSLYAATKKSNELMAHCYSHLYNLPTTGLRFFTVYGPWGRPDMAYFLFTRAILKGKPIKIFNHGKMRRDFTYVDDIVEGICRVMNKIPTPNPGWDRNNPTPASSWAPYRVFNIGNNQPVELMEMIRILEEGLGREARKEYLPMQPGDVEATYADVADLEAHVGFAPQTSLQDGLGRFLEWYRGYYGE